MAQTFNVAEVSYATNQSREPRVTSVRFDDGGYELRMRRGMNADLQTWEVQINVISTANANAVEAFLALHEGVDWFWWSAPRSSVAKKFVCRRWTREPISPKHDRMTMTFQEVVDLVG
jgi:phage-related protein